MTTIWILWLLLPVPGDEGRPVHRQLVSTWKTQPQCEEARQRSEPLMHPYLFCKQWTKP